MDSEATGPQPMKVFAILLHSEHFEEFFDTILEIHKVFNNK